MDKIRHILLAFLALTGLYLYALPAPNLPYAATVILHIVLGLLLTLLMLPMLFTGFRGLEPLTQIGWPLLVIGAASGIALGPLGTLGLMQLVFYLHIISCVAGVFLIVPELINKLMFIDPRVTLNVSLIVTGLLLYSAWTVRHNTSLQGYVITNPAMPPGSMDEEGDGPDGPFFPSSAQTADGELIPATFFMESENCKRCHEDIYKQWQSSAHRFSSFNNQWYRKSVEYAQDIVGPKPTKWCAGCHDPALLFSGMMDDPIAEHIDKPVSHAGLGCVACHSIVAVRSTMGQGNYVIEYPALHDLATDERTEKLHDFLVNVNPEPHRRAFLKPFMREQTAEYCTTCHKVHLDVPVNGYRWLRGFNEYDNWQASGVSGQGARSFYYPPQPMDCADCHMPPEPTTDTGNSSGFVRSHRFPAANTALPTANQDEEQLAIVREFLDSGAVTVDIFALLPAQETLAEGANLPGRLSTSFAVGEEAEPSALGATPDAVAVTAPLDTVRGKVVPGRDYRLDVVVRTKSLGHFFPGGTVDAYDVWLELKATDCEGNLLFWSGKVADDGRGPVEKGAHFYRSRLIDAHGNPIDKRNAWAARAVVYVRLIPPGAADTVHFRLRVPESVGDEIIVEAKLNYRKFSWQNTRFAYAGVRDPDGDGPAATMDYDDAEWSFDGDTSNVSGKLKQIPVLPIVMMAESTVVLRAVTLSEGEPAPGPETATEAYDWERWNDYGIGLLLQGDLRGAERAFRKVTEAAPDNPDGWVNLGRVAVREGNVDAAGTVLGRALEIEPDLARAHFFYAKLLKSLGDYDEALDSLRIVTEQYPRDRVALNETGRILFLQKRYAEAAEMFEQTLAIDPENLQAHYNLGLCYKMLGDDQQAKEHEKRYLRFKADESAQVITGPYLLAHPEDNRERQMIHEHSSVPLATRAETGDGN